MTLVIIPSFTCNFRCRYCYLHNSTKLSQQTLNAEFICSVLNQFKEQIQNKQQKFKLIWHGGEPLLWGEENYKKVFEFIGNELPSLDVQNSIQCNLSLITPSYIELFKRYNVKVGFSLDGEKEINDAQRVFVDGEGTFDKIMGNLELCRKNGLKVGCVTVCSKKHVGKIKRLYHFMNSHKLNFKLNPLFETGEAVKEKDELSITALEYADMMIELFDLGMADKNNVIVEENLLEMGSSVATGVTKHCLFGYNCQDNFLAIAPTGDVMPCGRFCDNDLLQYSYGNLHEEALGDIMARVKQTETYKRAEYIAQSGCAKCKWYHICHGGCLHDGFLASGDFKHKTFLCPAYKKIFAHIEKRIQEDNLEEAETPNSIRLMDIE